ncbi:MAG: hypothetical protein R3Y61_02205 [Rikenellaceae bacterium]
MKKQILRYIAVVSVCLFSVMGVMAQGVSIKYNGEDFLTSGRKVVVKSPVAQLQTDLSEWMLICDAVVMTDVFSKMFSPSVKLKYVNEIDGKRDSYKVTVKKNKIVVQYTDLELLEDAIAQLYKLEGEGSSGRIIRGAVVSYAKDRAAKIKIRTNSAGIYDGISKKQSNSDIQEAIRAQVASDDKKFIFAIVNKSLFRVDFDVFKEVNPSMASICTAESYSKEEILSIVQYAEGRGGSFVPALDLLSDNAAFESFTGHKIHSVEGMRFVRAIIEECANVWGVQAICVGTLAKSDAPNYYIDFLQDMADRNSVELIIL